MTQPILAKELADLLDRHANSLRMFAAQWSNAPDDCVQEAFVELAGKRPAPARPIAWLFQVVRRRAINELRGSKRRTSREQRSARDEASFNDPSNRMIFSEEQQRIQSSLDELPVETRELIALRIWSDLKWSEIGALTGCSSSTAQRRFVSALKKLKDKLESPCLTKPK